MIKKKGSQPMGTDVGTTNESNVKLTLKELLNVSSDWKEVNKKNPSSSSSAIGALPIDF